MKRAGIILILFCIILVILYPIYCYADTSEENIKDLVINMADKKQFKKTIVVGDDKDYPPYSFLDRNGYPAGFDIELIKAALEAMGYNVEFKLGNWSDVRKQLEKGKIDAISGMFYSEEREKIYDFTTKLTVANSDVFTRTENKINDIKELEGLTVVVQKDNIVQEYLKTQDLNIKFIEVSTAAEALKLVSDRKYDYAAVQKTPGYYAVNSLKLSNLMANGISISQNNYVMAVKKNNEDLLLTLNGGLEVVKATGKYQEIYDKWLGVYEEKSIWDHFKKYILLESLIAVSILFLVILIFILKKLVAIKTKELLETNEILRDNQYELNASNEEIQAAYQQLAASEEELKAQYNEIQSYAERVESLNQKYQIAIQGTDSVVWEYNINDKTIYLSEEFKNTYKMDFKENENIYRVLDGILVSEEKEKLLEDYNAYIEGKKEEIYSQIKIIDKNNNLQWILVRGRGIYDENRKLKFINGIILHITKLKENEEYIEHLAYNDSLTNLPNRIRFMEKLKKEINENQSGAMMMLDIDNFKGINDTLGHIYGDKILKRVAEEFLNIADEKLFISRFGGDEFLILVQREKDICEIEKYANKILDIFNKKLSFGENQIYAGCSIGITLYPFDSNDADELIMNADVAMYKVKDFGKNSYMFFNREMTDRLKGKIQIERILREAVKKDRFKLLYQPQVCTITGEIVGFEALLRLKDYTLSPGTFIQVAEETSLIMDIGRWVTKEVITQISAWKRMGLNIKPVAINLSAKQLNDLKYIDFLQDLLKFQAVEPECLDIEITESIFLEKKDETIEFLNRLKNLGIKITLDDFGTGYSSLNYLTFIPVDKIKLDKSLCDKFLELENISVMDSIISLAHSLNLKVVAEGIEELEQYKRLKVGKCDYIQGYFFSKPLEAEKIEKIYNYKFM